MAQIVRDAAFTEAGGPAEGIRESSSIVRPAPTASWLSTTRRSPPLRQHDRRPHQAAVCRRGPTVYGQEEAVVARSLSTDVKAELDAQLRSRRSQGSAKVVGCFWGGGLTGLSHAVSGVAKGRPST